MPTSSFLAYIANSISCYKITTWGVWDPTKIVNFILPS